MDDVIARVIDEVRPYTMAPIENLTATMRLTVDVIENERPGDLVECGTWMGGSSFAMLLVQRYLFGKVVKPVWMFDSFEGLPPPDERDGALALEYHAHAYEPGHWDNCTAPLPQVQAAIASIGFSNEEVKIVPGWFHDAVPTQLEELASSQISLLRVDCDWYEPVLYVLRNLAPLVSDECPIILDDYYAWDGCALATHDYLSGIQKPWRIRSIDNYHGAWMMKRAGRTNESGL